MIFVNFNLFSNGYIILNSKAAEGYAADGVSLLPTPPNPRSCTPPPSPSPEATVVASFLLYPSGGLSVWVCAHTRASACFPRSSAHPAFFHSPYLGFELLPYRQVESVPIV